MKRDSQGVSMDDTIQLIKKSPFVKHPDAEDEYFWSIELKDPVTGKLVAASIHPDALMDSLGEESGETDLLVCGCSDAGCAGFANERFESTDRFVHWRLTEYRRPYSWYFDRAEYEAGAVEMLHEIYVSRRGWRFNALYYDSYDDFKSAVEKFLAAKPYFRTIWNKIDNEKERLK